MLHLVTYQKFHTCLTACLQGLEALEDSPYFIKSFLTKPNKDNRIPLNYLKTTRSYKGLNDNRSRLQSIMGKARKLIEIKENPRYKK